MDFVEYAKPSESQRALLILDYCSFHVDASIIDYANEHHITLLSFLTILIAYNLSHVSVFGPLKTYEDQKMNTWTRENPGRSMSVHVIPSIVSCAFPLAFTPSNIAAGFRKTDIYLFDRNAITSDKYLQSYGTYREFFPDPEEMDPTKETNLVKNSSSPYIQIGVESIVRPQFFHSIARRGIRLLSNDACLLNVSTEIIRPLGHLEPRPSTSRSRSKVKSTIYIDTPIRNHLLLKKMKRSSSCYDSSSCSEAKDKILC